MIQHDNPTPIIDAIGLVVLHPIGKLLLALLVWSFSFAYTAGSFKAEVRALRVDVQRMEERLTHIDDFLRGRYQHTTKDQ